MSIENVREYLRKYGKDGEIIEFQESSATVKEAAADLGTEDGRIAKSMSFMTEGGAIIIVLAGDMKIDNRKFKDIFHEKARMVFLDISLRRFATVFPAAGSPNSAIELTPDELEALSGSVAWIDVAKEI